MPDDEQRQAAAANLDPAVQMRKWMKRDPNDPDHDEGSLMFVRFLRVILLWFYARLLLIRPTCVGHDSHSRRLKDRSGSNDGTPSDTLWNISIYPLWWI